MPHFIGDAVEGGMAIHLVLGRIEVHGLVAGVAGGEGIGGIDLFRRLHHEGARGARIIGDHPAAIGVEREFSVHQVAMLSVHLGVAEIGLPAGTDVNGVIERVNAAFTRITGYSAQEAIGRRGDLMHSGLQDAAFYEVMWAHLKTKGRWQGEVWNRRKSGEVYPQWLAITEVSCDGEAPLRYVGTMIDITDRKAREEEIAQLAFYDPLTDLPNRRLMKDRLQQALVASGRSKREGALMFIDLDRFKEINDTLGHDKGDRLLQCAALRLVACVREGDTVARIGGDEFVVMLPPGLSESSSESATLAEAIGDKILKAMREPYEIDGLALHLSASIGITLFGALPTTVEELLQRADQAMYQAKAAGRDALRFFDAAAQDDLRERSFIEADLRVALTQGQLRLDYQPVFNVAGKMIGAEALIRWQHPQRGLLLPDEFVSVAEDTGQIFALGHWALDAACAQLARWSGDAVLGELNLAVNVCAMQLLDDEFVPQVLALVHRPPAWAHLLRRAPGACWGV